MPYVSNSPTTANTFYVAFNLMFDLDTGGTKRVLLLVNKPEDASVFTATDAQKYLTFIQVRAQTMVWSIEQLSSPHVVPGFLKKAAGVLGSPERFIIKGVQYV